MGYIYLNVVVMGYKESINPISTIFINHLHHNTPAMENPEWINKLLELVNEAKNKKKKQKPKR